MRIDVDLAALAQRGSGALQVAGIADADRHAENGATAFVVGMPRDAATGETIDAAAVLARYTRDGKALADGLHGSFAIAVVDAATGRTSLFNDRMAVHGWSYRLQGHRLSIAPRADTLADGAALDPQALFSYLSNHVIASPETVFSGVARLPPGHRASFDISGTELSARWVPRFDDDRTPDLVALSEEFRSLVQRAVQREWGRHGQGRCASFLSGGTDSSTVSGMLRRIAGNPTAAYSIGFDADGYDEMAYARIAARHFGLDHRERYLTPQDVARHMPAVAASYDQPFGNSSAVAAYHCARVAREEGCTALLAGDGGDELFGGNARYAKQSIFGWYEAVPRALRRGLIEPLLDNRVAGSVPVVSKGRSYVQQARVPMPDRLHMYNLLRRLGLDEVLTPDFLAAVDPEADMVMQRQVYATSDGAHLVNRMLAYDWRYTLADNDLPKVRGTAALAGIEVAFPLLADEIVDFSLRLPHRYKLKGLQLRWFFKHALKDFLPQEILVKKKQGFGLPFGVWALRDQGLAALADDAMASFSNRGIVSPAFMRRLRGELLPAHPGYYGELVWVITMLELWLRDKRPDYRLGD